jgi:hypothetical protein
MPIVFNWSIRMIAGSREIGMLRADTLTPSGWSGPKPSFVKIPWASLRRFSISGS